MRTKHLPLAAQYHLGLEMAKDACTEFVLRYGRRPEGKELKAPLMIFLYWTDEATIFKWGDDEQADTGSVAKSKFVYLMQRGQDGHPHYDPIPKSLGKLCGGNPPTKRQAQKQILKAQLYLSKQALIEAAKLVEAGSC